MSNEKSIRAHVIIPKTVIKQLDNLVGNRGRSKFIVEAVIERMGHILLVRTAKKVAGSLADTYIPEWDTSEKAAEWVSTLRKDADKQRRVTVS